MSANPVGDQCEDCFDLHEDGFPDFSWDELCSANGEGGEVSTQVSTFRKRKMESCSLPFKQNDLVHIDSVVTRFSRSVVVLNDRELRAACGGLGRLNKQSLGTLPTVAIPSEDEPGETEIAYVFMDPDKPYRTGVMEWSSGVLQNAPLMKAASHLYEEQATRLRHHYSRVDGEASGVGNVLAKCKGGHLKDLADFSKKFGKCAAPETKAGSSSFAASSADADATTREHNEVGAEGEEVQDGLGEVDAPIFVGKGVKELKPTEQAGGAKRVMASQSLRRSGSSRSVDASVASVAKQHASVQQNNQWERESALTAVTDDCDQIIEQGAPA